ncbi:RPS15 [Symbiodinium sp. KB8]|nr:RPS15 [Symbiodinium sp. KB8]
MASELTDEQLAALKKRRQFKKFSFRGIDLEKLLEMSNSPELVALLPSRIRRRFRRATIDRKHMHLMKKLRKSKRECGPLDKPEPVRTHLRNMIILPEMIGNVIYIYNGRGHVVVEVRPDMIGKYFGEFSITYKPTLHGRPGLGATHSSRFIPLH